MSRISILLLSFFSLFLVIPVQAAVVTDYQYATGEYSNADANLALHISDDSSDIVKGVAPSIVSGAFHGATPGDDASRLASLVDGAWASSGVTVIAQDNEYPADSLQVGWTFGTAKDIYSIVIFAGHDEDGARGFINCKVEVDTGSGYTTLIDEAKTGEYGKTKESAVSASLRIRGSDWGKIVTGCVGLRIKFYQVSHNSIGYLQKYNDNTTNPPVNYPNQGTILKEIDVFDVAPEAWTPTNTPTATNTPEPVPAVHEGANAARIQWTNIWSSGMDQGLDRVGNYIPTTAGNEVQVSAWIRNATQGQNHAFRMTLSQFTGGAWQDVELAETATDAWQKYSLNLTTGGDVSSINLAFRMVSTGGGSIVIDDVTAVDVTNSNTPITFTNPGFEDWPGLEYSTPPNWRFFQAAGATGEVQRISEPTPTNTPVPTNTATSTYTPASGVGDFEIYE